MSEYLWYIKRYKDDTIKVSPKVGFKAQQAWLEGAETLRLPDDIVIASSSISAIEPSTELYESNSVYMLGSGLNQPGGKPEPILNTDGEVITNWYKKNVGSKAWEKYYAALPAYYKIVDDSGAVWVAMRLPEEKNRDKSKELVVCDEREQEHLWGQYQARHQN